MVNAVSWIEGKFPRLREGVYETRSPIDQDYNCIAFAAGDTERWWWPKASFLGGAYWPDGAPREETLSAFQAAFGTLGYEPCESGDLEPGHERVAIYAEPSGMPTHAARQLPDGTWVSKLGQAFDIMHLTPEGVGGSAYGEVVAYLRRPAAD